MIVPRGGLGFVTLRPIVVDVGLLNALRLSRSLADNVTPLPVSGIVSPWSDRSHLQTVVWSDILGGDSPTALTRASAMRVGAVARGRNLIAPTIARCLLTRWRKDEQMEPAPWMTRGALGVTPYHRMLWTVDDLIFSPWSLWTVERGAKDQVLNAARVPLDWWTIDPDSGRIMVQAGPQEEKRAASVEEVVLIPGPHDGILNFGQDVIRQASALSAIALDRAENPDALTELHYTGDRPMTDQEIESVVQSWLTARKKSGGARVGYTGKNLEVKTHGTGSEQLLIEARNAAAVEVAQIIGLPAAMLDATAAGASLTYETTEGRNGQFIDYGLSTYMDPIAARLSEDDLVPAGQSTRFDTTVIRDIAPPATGPATED